MSSLIRSRAFLLITDYDAETFSTLRTETNVTILCEKNDSAIQRLGYIVLAYEIKPMISVLNNIFFPNDLDKLIRIQK